MSYILDALKKAEAQRALGALPNIHAPAAFAATPDARASLWRRASRWGALTALVTILVALAWFRPWQRGAVPPTRSAAPAASIAPALPPPVRAVPAPPTPKITPKSVPPQASKPKSAASRLSSSLSLPQQQPAADVAPAKKPAPTPAPTLPAAAPEPELLTLRELPAQIQTQIPTLVISGYIYSSSRAERSLLINNQLLREGDTVVPGLILEQMLPGAVVLNYQGYRYRMPY